jgi:hypothetical protein
MENWCPGQNNLPLAPGPGPQNGLRDSPRPRPRGALVLGLKLSRDHSRNPESRSRVSVPMRANANAPLRASSFDARCRRPICGHPTPGRDSQAPRTVVRE